MVNINSGVKMAQHRRQYNPGLILHMNSMSLHNRFTPIWKKQVENSDYTLILNTNNSNDKFIQDVLP